MSTIFAIDGNNGFLKSGGTIKLVTQLEAVVINCQHEAQTLRGEDPYRQNKGMPNFKQIWNGTPDVLQFEFFLRQVLGAVADVERLSNFKASVVRGELSYSIDITTPFGTDTVSGSI